MFSKLLRTLGLSKKVRSKVSKKGTQKRKGSKGKGKGKGKGKKMRGGWGGEEPFFGKKQKGGWADNYTTDSTSTSDSE